MIYMYNTKGIALLLSLIIMVILLVLGGAYMYMVRLEAYISKNQRDSTDALYIAEAGMERGIRYFVEQKGTWTGSLIEYLDSGQTKKYTVTSGASPLGTDWRRLTSIGTISESGTNLAERRLQADVSIVAFKFALLADHDINRSTASGRVNGRVHANGVVYLPASMLDTGQPEPSSPAVSMPEIDMSYDSSGNPSSTNYYANSANFPTVTHSLVPGDMSFVGAYSNTVYYIQGIATIYVTDQDTSFTNCILVAEGTIATTTVDTVSPYNTVTVNDTSGFASQGKAVINREYFTYTGKTASAFTGCSGITSDHFTGETVLQVNSSTLSADVIAGSNTVTLADTTGFSYPAGSAFISQEDNLEGESFTYKNITGNTLNGCTGIDSNYTVGARVIQHGDSIVIKGNDIIQDGNYSITGSGPVKNIVTFNVKNIGLGDVVIDRFGASWTPTDSVELDRIEIGAKSWNGNLNYLSGATPIDLVPDSDTISSGAITTVRLTFNADMRSRSIKVDFYEIKGELYSFTLINPPPGPKSFSFSVMKDPNDASRTIYPALAAKFGNIVEGSSTDRNQVQISGIVFSEQGRIQFDHTNLTGAIVASEMDLINSNSAGFGITVNYGTKSTVPDPAPEGFTGGLTIVNWREVY